MKEFVRRVLRKEPAAPPPPIYSEITMTDENPNFYEASFNGHEYRVRQIGTLGEFKTWFDEYSQKGPQCGNCERIIFPNSQVSRDGEGLFRHFTEDCTPEGGGLFIGTINHQGELNPVFPDGESLIQHVFNSGNDVLATFGPDGVEIKEGNPRV